MEYHNSGESRYYLCDVCQLLLLGTDIIVSHLQRHHGTTPSQERLNKMRRFPCLLCLFPFKHSGHRVDHFRANHRMDIKAFYTRNLKSNYGSQASPSSASPMSSIVHKKLLKKHKLKEREEKWERNLERQAMKKAGASLKRDRLGPEGDDSAGKSAATMIRFSKSAAKSDYDENDGDDDDDDDEVVSVSSSSQSVKATSSRRIGLKPELKDKFADILSNQPRVLCRDVCDEYHEGHYEYFTWNFFDKSGKKPKIKVGKK